jgi:hypothetical protein
MGQRIAQLYKILQHGGIGGVTRIFSSKPETKLCDPQAVCVPLDGFEVGISSVDQAITGRSGDQLRLVPVVTTRSTDHLDGREVEQVTNEALELGHDPKNEGFIELHSPGLGRPARSTPGSDVSNESVGSL